MQRVYIRGRFAEFKIATETGLGYKRRIESDATAVFRAYLLGKTNVVLEVLLIGSQVEICATCPPHFYKRDTVSSRWQHFHSCRLC